MRKRWVCGWIVALAAALGSVGGPAHAGLISERQEIQMGADAAQQIEAKYPLSKDAARTALVQRLGERLAAVSSRPGLSWHFRVIENDEVNALSVPGYVYVNTGLMDFVGGDRDQLAAVIAHEVAHTTRKHAARQTEKALIGSLALRFVFKDRNEIPTQLAGAAANLAILGYGRRDEFEADRVGAEYLIQAGFDPRGMVRFFEKLRAKEGKESKGLAVYFRTHPPTSERIRKLKEHLAKRGS
ncbi:MAG: M48 family metalloprotease [Armatimonadetes bacterium]|nr:M48 family metalloprotease [Armatimonadota bacterium]